MNYRASRTTYVDLSVSRTINSGSSMTVFGVMITNSTNQSAEVEFQTADGSIKFRMNCPACDSNTMPIQFIADGGLLISGVGNADVSVTVFHSQAGS